MKECEDAISREDVIKSIQNKAKRLKNADTINGLCGAISIIYEMPSVYPKAKEGKWEVLDNMWWVCDQCFCKTRMMKKYNIPNYCPACGADMREGVQK